MTDKYIRAGVIWAAGGVLSIIVRDPLPLWVGWGAAMVIINVPEPALVINGVKFDEEMVVDGEMVSDLKTLGFASKRDIHNKAEAIRRGSEV